MADQQKKQQQKEKKPPPPREEKSRDEVMEERKRKADEKKKEKEARKAKAAARNGEPAATTAASSSSTTTTAPPPPSTTSSDTSHSTEKKTKPPSLPPSSPAAPAMPSPSPHSTLTAAAILTSSPLLDAATPKSRDGDNSSNKRDNTNKGGVKQERTEGGVADKRPRGGPTLQYDDARKVEAHAKKALVQRTQVLKSVPLFAHLPQYERETSLSLKMGLFGTNNEGMTNASLNDGVLSGGTLREPLNNSEAIHPAIIRLGLQLASGTLSGSNARCVAMLSAFHEVIKSYTTPPQKVLSRDLMQKLNRFIRFIIDCRPLSVSMGNAIRWLKMRISKIPVHLDEAEAKEQLASQIMRFIHERIALAATVIAENGSKKINDGDTIMTFACSSVVENIFKEAAKSKKFRVIVVDARPKLEGKEMLKRLSAAGIPCTYILINAISYVMKDVSKVFIGAAACLTNGAVISRCGSAVIAMMAHTYKKPFLVACETYKFHDRAQVDSICSNELGDPDDLIRLDRENVENVLAEWRDIPRLKLLDLLYDLTPVEFVTMVVSEVGLIPPTSVPVILREYSHGTDDGIKE